LNAAHQLKKAGVAATIYEARGRAGGRIRSRSGALGEGLVTDLGGEFINTDHEDMLALVKEFGLRLFNRVADAKRFPFPETGYYFEGRLHPEDEIAELLRPLAEQISQDANRVDRDFDRFAPRFDRLSVAEYLDNHADKIPKPFIRTLIENSIRTEYGVEPEQSSALQLLFNLPTVDGQKVEVLGDSDETFVVEGGCARIIDALAESLMGQIRTRMYLKRIQAHDRGFRLTFSKGQVIDADLVILAIPFTVLRDIDIQVPLPTKLRRFIAELDLGANEKLLAGFAEKVWRRDNGFVLEAWTDLGFSEVWDETQRQTQREEGVLTFYIGGRELNEVRAVSTDAQGQRFVDRFEALVPGAKAAATGRFLRTCWTRSPLTRGGYTSFKPGQLTTFGDLLWVESDDLEERQEVRAGNLVFVGEHLSDEFYGFMNGAAQTGRLAAGVVLRRMQGEMRAMPAPA
jgi:monoamine oxidase